MKMNLSFIDAIEEKNRSHFYSAFSYALNLLLFASKEIFLNLLEFPKMLVSYKLYPDTMNFVGVENVDGNASVFIIWPCWLA